MTPAPTTATVVPTRRFKLGVLTWTSYCFISGRPGEAAALPLLPLALERSRPRVQLVELEALGEVVLAGAVEELVRVVVLERRAAPVPADRAPGECPDLADRAVALPDVGLLPGRAVGEGRSGANVRAGLGGRVLGVPRAEAETAAESHDRERGRRGRYCGSAGVLNQSHAPVPTEKSARQLPSSASWRGPPRPALVSQSEGRLAGVLVMLAPLPAFPVLSYQQLPVLPLNSSHQKSVPLGSRVPRGSRPITLP